jgi:hypothetical protein
MIALAPHAARHVLDWREGCARSAAQPKKPAEGCAPAGRVWLPAQAAAGNLGPCEGFGWRPAAALQNAEQCD